MNPDTIKAFAELPAHEEIVADNGTVTVTRDDAATTSQPKRNREPLRLNRAQRRSLKRYIERKKRRQAAIVRQRHPAFHDLRCSHCNLRYRGPASDRCQCKVTKHHE